LKLFTNMRVLLALAFLGLASASTGDFTAFMNFAKTFGKTYQPEDIKLRSQIFEENMKKIVEHNKRYSAGEVSWWMKVYEDMDLTSEEFLHKRTGLPSVGADFKPINQISPIVQEKLANQPSPPREWNWVAQGKVSSVKNQAQCGSCAAFAALATIESCFMIKNNDMANDLSEQHLLDCGYGHYAVDADGSWGAFGCDGAWPNAYWDYIQGQYNQEEAGYPYFSGRTGDIGSCSPTNSNAHSASYVTGFQNSWYTDEMDMENLLMINPVATAVSATDNWGGYGGGVLDDNLCCDAKYDPSCVNQLNHAVTVVGYGTEGGKDYWLVKNSWSTSWGENGYFKIKKGTGHCGVGALEQGIPTC